MGIFDEMAEAQFQVYEGQRQIAEVLARGLVRLLSRVLDRCLPNGTMAPW